jgi:hypothetical protein
VNLSDARMSTSVTISGRPDVLRQLKVSWNIPYTVNIFIAITIAHCQVHITAELEVIWTCSWSHNSTSYSWFCCFCPCVDFLWTFTLYSLQLQLQFLHKDETEQCMSTASWNFIWKIIGRQNCIWLMVHLLQHWILWNP